MRISFKTICLNILILCLAFIGFWQFGRGVYMTAKAQLSQVLLEHSWQESQRGKVVKPWPWADTSAVAKLAVPRLGIEQIVLAGASNRNLAFGPTHVLASSAIGEGSSIISAHRDTHFKFLQHLQAGDLISLESSDGTKHNYRVSFTEIADTRRTSLHLSQQDELILVTCYPFNVLASTGPLRYVVTAVPEESQIMTSK